MNSEGTGGGMSEGNGKEGVMLIYVVGCESGGSW